MSLRRAGHVVVALACAAAVLGACNTGAVGIEDCRAIEIARCHAARGCGFGPKTAAELDECKRFARDNCLHGLALDERPKGNLVDTCVATLKAAGDCAAKDGKDALWTECSAAASTTAAADTTACDLVAVPERASTCAFLVPTAPQASATTAPVDAAPE